MAKNKIHDRVNKLLALAAPTSGAPEPERASAALEAARLIAEHGLVAGAAQPSPPPSPRAPPPPRQRPPAPQRPSWNDLPPYPPVRRQYWDDIPHTRYRGSDWTYAVAPENVECAACHKIIYRGEEAWHDFHHGFRHHDITCYER